MSSEPGPQEAVAPSNTSAGDAAFQLLEMLLLALIEKQIISTDALVAEIESLARATPDSGERAPALTVKGQLSVLANSLSAHATREA